jgi:peptide/nickel transport system permease protein
VISYLVKRLLTAVFTIFIVISLSFFMVRVMPGNAMDVLRNQLMRQGGLTTQEVDQQVNALYGLQPTDPVWKQYLQFLSNAAHGNLGTSLTNREPVMHIIANALPWTVFSVGLSLIVSFVIGIAMGTAMAAFPAARITKFLTLAVSFISAVPNYLIALVLLYLLADTHRIFPQGGAYSVNVHPGWNFTFIGSAIEHAVLPVAAYAIVGFGGWALQMKGSAISVMGAEYVRAAEARGLRPRRIAQSYIGRNSMLPQVTLLALSLGFMFGGSVFIEQLFNYPGIGYYLVTAVGNRDYSLMMGCFVLITISVVIANLLVDLIYPLVDPRIANPAAAKRSRLGAKGEATETAAPVAETMS